jgi:hypothetical protein
VPKTFLASVPRPSIFAPHGYSNQMRDLLAHRATAAYEKPKACAELSRPPQGHSNDVWVPHYSVNGAGDSVRFKG